MKYLQTIVFIIFCFGFVQVAAAGVAGEFLEPTPEELDDDPTQEDAARAAALWSDEIINRDTVDPLGDLVHAADLIIRGEVVSQSYSYDDTGVPFTHTTIAIIDVLSGDYAGAEFTVVQEGGPAQDDDKRAMLVSGSKNFNVGEEELLFLKFESRKTAASSQTHSRIEPVYTGPEKVTVQQRFRIYEDKVYNEDGHGVIVEPVAGGEGHRLRLTRDRSPAPRFREIHVGRLTLGKKFVSRAEDTADSADAGPLGADFAQSVEPSYTAGADVAALSTAITQLTK